MATSAKEYLTSIWKNERSVVPLLFFLGALLTTAIGLGFCIYYCCSRLAYEHKFDIEKANDASDPSSDGRRLTSTVGPPVRIEQDPRRSQPQPPVGRLCDCRVVYGPCHGKIDEGASEHEQVCVDESRNRHAEAIMNESGIFTMVKVFAEDKPPSYEDLMAFGRV